MLLIRCPYCNDELPELEYSYAGEAHVDRPPDPASLDDEAWRDFLFVRRNPRGLHLERWRHAFGCGRFFNAVRDTATDEVIHTYHAGEPRPDLEKFDRGAS